ncbi:MAG: DUF1080 domain-containing protein [Acidobacteria bacterium]|nr:DUF1080 domain-containing protein [Acidobacteriota bacterium]
MQSSLVAMMSALAVLAMPAPGASWQSLFDGKTLKGWHVESKPADQGKVFWRAADGAIVCDSLGRKDHDYFWLVSDAEFGDFEFTAEVRGFSNSPGNSGVQFRSRYDREKGWLDGPQMDVHPPAPWRTGLIYDETREVRRWIFPSLKDSRIEQNQGPAHWKWNAQGWNRLRLVCQGTRVRTEVNGVVITDTSFAGLLDDEAHRLHSVGLRGHLALQLHVKDELKIEYRKLKVRVLP